MKLTPLLAQYIRTPISFKYTPPMDRDLRKLKAHSRLTLIDEEEGLVLGQTYFKIGHPGTSKITFTRLAILDRIHEALRALQPHFGLYIFDVYRSLETQRALFEEIGRNIKHQHPQWTKEQLFLETKKYVVHPDDTAHFPVAPHNSGGAIDLTLHRDGKPISLGSSFDDPRPVSSTLFFEQEYDSSVGFTRKQWQEYHALRRILFHTMTQLGFTNYSEEWWHYDLGNCPWAKQFNVNYFFDSMEPQVNLFLSS